MTFNYLKHTEYLDTIDIENVGNVILDIFNDEGSEWLLYIDTSLGYTQIIICGPFVAETNSIGNYFNFNYSLIEYNEKKLFTTINNFINDDRKVITLIFFIDKTEFLKKLQLILEFLIYYGESKN